MIVTRDKVTVHPADVAVRGKILRDRPVILAVTSAHVTSDPDAATIEPQKPLIDTEIVAC